MWEIVDRLASPTLTKKERETLETNLGVNHNPQGLLLDLPLREHVGPATTNFNDFMHVYLANGIVNDEICRFMREVLVCKRTVTF